MTAEPEREGPTDPDDDLESVELQAHPPSDDLDDADDSDGSEDKGPERAGRDPDDDAEPTYRRFDVRGPDATGTADAVDAARRAVEDGDCIVLPTDTVYGIGADAFSAEAVQRLLDAKDRGRDMPPPVLVGDASLIRALATDVPDQARDLVDAHWPGALTIVCRIQPSLHMDLGDTDGTIALRVPDHPLAREILRRTGPLAVSSANLSGRPAALTCDEAVAQLGNRVAVYLDGGPLGAEQADPEQADPDPAGGDLAGAEQADAEQADGEDRTGPAHGRHGAHALGAEPATAGADGGGGADRERVAARHALPSTIVDFTRYDDGQVLRRGAIDLAALRAVVPGLRDLEDEGSR